MPSADWINVKDYGAQGNNSTDDTIAIQKAIDAAKGGVVYVPQGSYVISNTLIIRSPMTFMGADSETSILRMVTAGKDGLQIRHTQGVTVTRLQVRDITNLGPNESRAIHVLACQKVILEHCKVVNTDDSGIRIGYDGSTNSKNCKVLYCYIQNASEGSGIELMKAEDSLIEGNTVIDSREHGIRVCGAVRSIITGNSVTNNTVSGISLQGFGGSGLVTQRIERIIVSNNICIGNSNGSGISVYNNVNRGLVSNNHIADAKLGIRIEDPNGHGNQDIQFTGNTISDCTTPIAIKGEQKRLTFRNNLIVGFAPNGTSTAYAFDLTALNREMTGIIIENNDIVNGSVNNVQSAVRVSRLPASSTVSIRYNNMALAKPANSPVVVKESSSGTVITTLGSTETNTVLPYGGVIS